MSQWKNDDSTANSVLWGPSQYKKTANSAERDALFGNTTANAYVTNETIGMYGADAVETAYNQYALVGATVGNNVGDGYIVTSNATTQITVNGGTSSVTAIINVESIGVSSVAVNAAAGQGFVNGDIVAANTGTGSQARFVVTANATGNVDSVSLVEGYRGSYTVFPDAATTTVAVTGSGNSLVLDVTAGIESLSVVTAGVYTVLPTVENNLTTADGDQTGTGARVNLKFKRSTTPATHAGWVIVTQKGGNKTGRTQVETLVAGGSMTGDAEDSVFAN